jgi:hypothetical protein
MSGGAFEYFYYKIDDDLGRHTQTLAEIIERMEGDPSRYDPEAVAIIREFGQRVTAIQEEAKQLSDLLHAIEWVASNDYAPASITEAIQRMKDEGNLPGRR